MRVLKAQSAGWRFPFIILWLLLFSIAQNSQGQFNSWTNPASAAWQQPYWSLGVLPASAQSVIYFTNSNWKAVGIEAATVNNFPGSLLISNLVVSAPAGSSNTLLLNYAGFQTPLRVLNRFTLGSNATVRLLSSRLEVGQEFLVGSAVSQEDGAQVYYENLTVGRDSPGFYNLLSGLVNAKTEQLGGLNYWAALFHQEAGTNRTTSLLLHPKGRYELRGGEVASGRISIGDGDTMFHRSDLEAVFDQSAGRVVITNDLLIGSGYHGAGSYLLTGGTISSDAIHIGLNPDANGCFCQLGGTNQCRLLSVSEGVENLWPLPDGYTYSSYFLGGGRLATVQSRIGAGRPFYFTQTGGVYEVSEMLTLTKGGTDRSIYSLSGGIIQARAFTIASCEFCQYAGTNRVSTSLRIEGHSSYELRNGSLFTQDTFLNGGGGGYEFHQSGGLHVATNVLLVGYSPTNNFTYDNYVLEAGQLTTDTISMSGTFQHKGGVLTPPNLLLYGGKWISAVPYQAFRQLDPRGDPKDISTIVFAATNCILRFESSVYPDWLGTLIIEGWQGSTNGGGAHQISFGTNASGLGMYHLLHTWFRNPANFAPALYPARMLSTGELVPDWRPTLLFNRQAGRWVLNWTGNYFLYSATNVTGPYTYLSGAASPFTNTFSERQRYFQLRR